MIPQPSPLLVTEATSSLPEIAAVTLMVWITAVVVLRTVLLLERSRLDWAVSSLIAAYVGTALLRDRAVQSVLTRWIPLADMRLVTHVTALAGAGAVLWVGLLWRATEPVSRRTLGWIAVGVAALGVALAWLSAPAREANIAIEQLGSWRTPAYIMVYSLPTPLAEIPVFVTSLFLVRHWRDSWSRAIFGAGATACLAVSAVDSGSRMLSAWLLFAGAHDEFTATRASSNDLLFLVPLAGLMLLAIPSIVASAGIRLHRDRATRNIRTLTTMWQDMMAARPDTRLRVPVRDSMPQVTEHRMRIEIEDVILSAVPWLTRLGKQPTPAQVCAALRSALLDRTPDRDDMRAGAPDWIGDERFVVSVAREWDRTRSRDSDLVEGMPIAAAANAIPHPPRRVPILGDVLGIDRKHPNQKTLWQFSQLGPLYRRSFVGGVHLTFAGSAALMPELLDEQRWQRHFGRPYEKLVPIARAGLFTAANDSPDWVRGHEVLMPGFTRAAMADYHEVMTGVVDRVEHWLGDQREVRDTAAMMGDAALETIGLAGFGYWCGAFGLNEKRAQFAAALTAVFAYVHESAIPMVGQLAALRRARRHAVDLAFMKNTVLDVIRSRRRAGGRYPDLLDRMLYPESGPALPDENVADQVLTFLIAGHETTGNLMAFAVYFLATHPDLAAQVRAEARALTTDGRIEFDDVAKLRVTSAVVNESLRLWPPAPGFFRAAREDTTLGGHTIKQGEWVFASLLAVHRDPTVWGENADTFQPRRFLEGPKPPAWAYRPFGTGPRSCIGMAFALHEARLMLAALIRDYETTTVAELDVEENLTLRPSRLAVTFSRV